MNKRQLHLPLKRRRPTAGRLSIMEGATDYQNYQEMSLVSESYHLLLTNKRLPDKYIHSSAAL
jgi:hypothetical protein